MTRREVGWRLFAQEFMDTDLYLEGEEERDPNYLITPLGAKVNRVFVVGTMTEKENVKSPEDPFWNTRITDPTGMHFVSAGQYQPEATSQFQQMEIPSFAAVVGKINVYEGDDGDLMTSLRAENVKNVGENERDLWTLKAAKSTIRRLKLVDKAQELDELSKDSLMELGFKEEHAENFLKAHEHYGEVNTESYWNAIENAVKFILPEYESKDLTVETGEEGGSEIEDFEKIKSEIMELLEEKIEEKGASEHGVDFNDFKDYVTEETDISDSEFEEAVDDLRANGELYEPVLGNLNTI